MPVVEMASNSTDLLLRVAEMSGNSALVLVAVALIGKT